MTSTMTSIAAHSFPFSSHSVSSLGVHDDDAATAAVAAAAAADDDDDADDYDGTNVQFTGPDLYGQFHPIETPQLITAKLRAMDAAVEALPASTKISLIEAQRVCPHLLTDAFKLRFLRCDVFHAKKAARRYAAYWNKRVYLFGSEAAFRPLTVASSMDSEADRVARAMGLFHVFECGDRMVALNLFCNYSLHQTNRTSVVKAFWYLSEAALEHEETQKRGIVVLNYPVGVKLRKQQDVRMAHMLASLKGCLPTRLSAYHVLHPPSWVKVFVPLLNTLLGERLRKRVLFHTGSPQEVLRRLECEYGLTREDLPREIGGSRTLDMDAFYEQRLAAGL